MSSLQQNRISMVVEECLLPLGGGPHIHNVVCCHSHSIQRRLVRDGRNDQFTRILKADETAVKKMIDRGS